MKFAILLFAFFQLMVLLPTAKTAPIFGPWGSSVKPDAQTMAMQAMGADYATFALAEAPKPPGQGTSSLLSRFPIFDIILPWGTTKTEMPQDIGSMYNALSEPEREVFPEIIQNEIVNSGDLNPTKIKGYNWKSIFSRLWGWARSLLKSFRRNQNNGDS